ncbi:hypothetical protein BD324DRAFT_653398 [Kockovaella imperatae]|uniref:Single-stranded DNA-binding protein n=1 Tax=Kockovaella imperatae TaxID=4999 RepID=A0A1Y1U7Y8_9TREE|nr:hypothetical protein BD324DRAFT_653398 [Kockovaella imperatae]ORX34122.1 hypothetical protein BD324DRAFT_653398 [Kockovaella imperatae]
MLPIRAVPVTRTLARAFSSSPASKDLSKLTLIGRLGADPVARTSTSGKEYYLYTVATQTPPTKGEDGQWVEGHTSWHNVFSFNEGQHALLKRVGKGSTVYVEAELEMRKVNSDESQLHDRVLLKQIAMRMINRIPSAESGEAVEEAADA